ncbi:MAG: RNA-binding protein [Phycisphaeraceae bacterium]|nr:RNA-binding protein [Phycisphaeraceae bacterium]
MKLYVGNLPFSIDDDQLRAVFEEHGEVVSASVVMDRETGRSRGFGFVEMRNENEGQAAIEQLHGANLGGRDLTVNEARPKAPRQGGGGYGGGGGGGRGGYGGGGGGRGGW